jgi:transposase
MIEWTPPYDSSRHHVPESLSVKKTAGVRGKHSVVAVDIARSVFEVAVSEEPGRTSRHRRLPRSEFLKFFAQCPAAVVVLEACGSAHHWGRELQRLGAEVVLLPPHQVRPYVTRNKTDRADAKGILEAYRNADIRPVPVKSMAQHVLGSIHRFRSGWIAARTAQVNTLRGLLREIGLIMPEGIEKVLPHLRSFVADAETDIPDGLRRTLERAT